MAINGSCLCGAVEYQIDKLASPIGFCHCTTCRKAHASAFAASALVAPSDFRWLKGRDAIKDFVSSPGKTRHFCGECGSHIVASKEGQDELILRVATLDSDPDVRPVAHIWTSHDVPWLSSVDLPRLPEGYPAR